MHKVITQPGPSKQCSPDGRTPSTRARSRATAGFSATISCTGRAYDVRLSVTRAPDLPHGEHRSPRAAGDPAVRRAPCAAATALPRRAARPGYPRDHRPVAADRSLHCPPTGVFEEGRDEGLERRMDVG